MDRRSLLNDEDAPEEHYENVFGDNNEVEDFDMVADGFRPTSGLDAQPDIRVSQPAEHVFRSGSIHNTVTREASRSSRNSIRKTRNMQNPFSHPDDPEGRFAESHHELQFEPDAVDVRRSISSASSAMFARTHSPRFGASAMPSHPYNMYPQDTMQRSSSTTTASTVRQQGRLYSPQPVPGPQHPYAMYPQGVDEDLDNEDEGSDLIQQNPVTVGFSGVGNRYRRQVGPDGEEQDIIGEDGHTEQLPPYSRYPEDGPEKIPLLVPTALHSRAPVHGSDPGMPLMHTTMQPTQEPQSMSDESALERPQSMASLALLRTPSSQISGSTEKPWSEKSWRERRSSRLCGIPVWWFLALLGLIIFAAAVIGGIAGGYLAGRRQNESENPGGVSVVTVITSLYDASQIASPTGAPPATGTFALALRTPQDVQRGCLAQPAQAVAWSCDLAPNADLAINVTVENNLLGANLFYGSNDFNITYGAQAPDLDTTFAQFLTVQDNDDPGNGPAFYFQQTYNKIVVVPEDAFNPATGKFRRDPPAAGFSPDAIPAGSKPWYCVWNETFLEGFIFIEQPMVTSSISSTSSTVTSKTISSTLTTSTTPTGGTAAVTAFPFPASANPNVVITTTLNFAPGAAATYTGPASGLSSWLSQNKPQPTPGSAGPGNRKRQAEVDLDWSSLPKYPNVIKLEERRVPGSAKKYPSYCQQYRILWDGRANWEPDVNGNPIKIWLDEQDPNYSAYQSAGLAGQTYKERRKADVVDGGCHCQWLSGGA